MALDHVLWLGGMGAIGKTTAARAIARRFDLQLYSIDTYTHDHARRLPPEPHRSLDEVWVESDPRELAAWFNDVARLRFPLILDDLRRMPDDAPILIEGPQLLPDLVADVTESPGRAVFVIGAPDLQTALLTARGSGVAHLASDPQRAFENRIRRDQILAEWLRAALSRLPFELVEVAEVTETEVAVEAHFADALAAWNSRRDRGDVSARRRAENDARLRQWRLNADIYGDPSGEVPFACECSRTGCSATVKLGLVEAEARRPRESLIAPGHE